jgi:hypothetical protein
MRSDGPTEFFFQVTKGAVLKHKLVHKFGMNPDIDTASGYETIWGGGGDYTGFSAAAQTVDVSSSSTADTSAGTGAQTIKVFGLDGSYNEVSEEITMNGTTAVTSSNSYLRLNRVKVLTAGSGGENAGIITVGQTTSGDVFAAVPIGYNQTMICVYTVPNGYKAYVLEWGAHLAGRSSATSIVRFKSREEGGTFQVKEQSLLQNGATTSIGRRYTAPKGPFCAGCDMFVEADTDANNTGISAYIDLVLVEEGS